MRGVTIGGAKARAKLMRTSKNSLTEMSKSTTFGALCDMRGRVRAKFGRALGMTPEQLLDAICFAMLHAGANALDIVDEAAGDALATESRKEREHT